ncbi:hypothetical protein DSO57_1034268 [Entomophthora muscae]|uniref:Uncharacterized protein n=1 Tax=Entomophthora muscae TaxID=34485 RepID=A0ACC2SDA2_9FUNG|nr:hypothetical protein DSO57_1034268 [Entomophthora muscae]
MHTRIFSGTRTNQTQPKTFHQTHIEQLVLWKNMLSLLDTHILEHNIQLDIAQTDGINRQDPKNLSEEDSYLVEEIKRLKETLFEISTKNSIKEKALDSINSATQYLKKLYSEEGRLTEFHKTASKHQALDIEAMSLVNEISKKERALFQLEEEISAETVANRVKFEQLEKLKSELAEKERDNISKAMYYFLYNYYISTEFHCILLNPI